MRISLETLQVAWEDAYVHGVPAGTLFDRFNIAHIKEFELANGNDGCELYFVVYEDNPDREGWYVKPFDRATNITELRRRDNIVFVVDNHVSEDQVHGLKYIRVPNIFRAIEGLCRCIVTLHHPRVIGVTGSVGKTTAAALIQHLVSMRFDCGRVYAKRLTPLTLSSWLVNYLNARHTFLALEYSLYRPHHVATLMGILPPEIGIFLNVKKVHLDVRGIKTLFDIRDGKRALVERTRLGILNADDPFVISLKREGHLTFSLKNSRADAFMRSSGEEARVWLNLTGESFTFTPYIKTDLFYHQVLASVLVTASLGVPTGDIVEALNCFTPAENRIGWITMGGQRMLFDADITTAGRLSAIAEHQYSSAVLLVTTFDFGEQPDVGSQSEYFSEIFGRFHDVRVLDEGGNRSVLSRHRFANCRLVPRERFLADLSEFDFQVLHFGGYFRKHQSLDHLFVVLNV